VKSGFIAKNKSPIQCTFCIGWGLLVFVQRPNDPYEGCTARSHFGPPLDTFPISYLDFAYDYRIGSFQSQLIPRSKWAKTESEGIIHSLGVRSLRFEQLDSMRGLAALVVVFHHFYLMFYRAHFRSNPLSALIYPFVAGHESVMLFFVLSGFVLSLPLMKQVPFSYPIYVCGSAYSVSKDPTSGHWPLRSSDVPSGITGFHRSQAVSHLGMVL
jgi:Acyltransferase family